MAYKAYGDATMLTMAQAAWDYANNYTLSAQDIQAGIIDTKNFTLATSCQASK